MSFLRIGGLALGAAIALAARPVVAQPRATTATEDSVRAVEMERARALLAADTVALSRMIAPEFLEISRRGTIRTRAENLQEISTGDLKLLTVHYDSLTVRVYGDVAVLMGIADNNGSYRGFAFSGKIRYLRIFVRREGRWQAVAMEQTPIQ